MHDLGYPFISVISGQVREQTLGSTVCCAEDVPGKGLAFSASPSSHRSCRIHI